MDYGSCTSPSYQGKIEQESKGPSEVRVVAVPIIIVTASRHTSTSIFFQFQCFGLIIRPELGVALQVIRVVKGRFACASFHVKA